MDDIENNKYNPINLEDKNKNLFKLSFPNFDNIPWHMKPTKEYINLIFNYYPFYFIEQ